jgi:hypothetical protein
VVRHKQFNCGPRLYMDIVYGNVELLYHCLQMFLVMTTSSFNQKQVGLLNCVLHLSGILTLVNIFYVGGLKHPYVISRNEM